MTAIEQRRHARVNMPVRLEGSVDFRHTVQVINLSRGGAMIEHLSRLSPGWPCLLGLRLFGVDLRLGGQIVWSHITAIEYKPNGEGELRFRSGLHFSAPPRAAEHHLRQYLTTLGAPDPEPGTGPAEPPIADANSLSTHRPE